MTRIDLLKSLWVDIERAEGDGGEEGVREMFYEHWQKVVDR